MALRLSLAKLLYGNVPSGSCVRSSILARSSPKGQSTKCRVRVIPTLSGPSVSGRKRRQERLDRRERDLRGVFLDIMTRARNLDDRRARPDAAEIGQRQSGQDRAIQHALDEDRG